MYSHFKDIKELLKQTYPGSISDIWRSFCELTQYVSHLDPVKLLSQLTLTFLTVPEDQFIEEGDEIGKWARQI